MKKKVILGIIALIGLCSFVVLGSSPQLIGNLIRSAQNNPVTRLFSSEVQTESEKSTIESTEKVKKIEVFRPEISAITNGNQTREVPSSVLWRVIFSFPEKLEKAAVKARQTGQDDSLWTDYFIRQGGLLPENNQILKEIANQHKIEVEAINEKARVFIEQFRQQNSKPSSTTPPAEIVELQEQKDEITSRYRDNFKNAIGEEAFVRFEKWVQEDFSKGFEWQTDSPLKDRKPDYDETSNNGFTSFNEVPKREIKTADENPKQSRVERLGNYTVNTIGYSQILYRDQSPLLVSGLAGTELRFFGYPNWNYEDYDPGVHSLLYRVGGELLSEGSVTGFRDITPAEGQHSTYYALPQNQYCVLSDHGYVYYYRINFVWYSERVVVRYTQDCHTFPALPTPTPTPPICEPIGNGVSPPCPTPSPTPTATIVPIDVVEKNGTKEVFVSVSNNASGITKFSIRTPNGTGNATFANNSTEVTVNGNTTNMPLTIKGVTESSKADNIKIEAKLNNSSTVSAQDDFTVAVITSLEFERINADDVALDNNPGTDGMVNPNGSEVLRIFPDKKDSGDMTDRSFLRIKAIVSPLVEKVNVHFATFDLDDPSAITMPIDTTMDLGNDNNGGVPGRDSFGNLNNSKSGVLVNPGGGNCSLPITRDDISWGGCEIASSGAAVINYKVTMQPGDNFAVAASLNNLYRNGINLDSPDGSKLINSTNQTIPISGEANPDNVAGLRTKMLTAWRRLHIEVDSMGQAHENYVRGNVSGSATIKPGPRATTLNVITSDLEVNRFEKGRLELAFITDFMDVISNTANTVTVKNSTDQNITLTNNVSFELLSLSGARSAVGTIPIGQTIIPNQTVTLTISGTPLDVNAFSNGQIFITPVLRSLTVTENTANTVKVTNNTTAPIVIADATHFRLYDDDDYNRNNTAATLNGDENEPIIRLPDSFRHLSDNLVGGILADGTPMNILASAYILPEYNWAENVKQYNQSNVVFDVNVEESETLGLEDIQRGSRNDERDSF